MPTIAAVDNVIETSCKIYDGKKREVSYKVMRALVVGYTIPIIIKESYIFNKEVLKQKLRRSFTLIYLSLNT